MNLTDEQSYWLRIIGIVLVLGVIGAGFGSFEGRAMFGFALGALLGPLGWIIVLLLPTAKVGSANPFEAEKRERRRMF